MNDDMREKLSLYLDGELDPAERELVHRRVETDPEWRDGLERLRRTSAVMKDFWKSETAGDPANPLAKSEAVARIVRESTLTLRRSAVDRAGRKGRGNRPLYIVLALALALAAAAAAVFYAQHDESAAALLRQAGGAALDGAAEVRIDFAQSKSLVFGTAVNAGLLPAECRLETAPEGRLHLSFALPGGSTQHFGFDGKRYWSWRSDEAVVRVFATRDDEETASARRIAEVWANVRESVRAAGSDASKARLIGRESLPGLGELSKIETHLDGFLRGNAQIWLDDRKDLRRVTVQGLTFHVTPRRLTAADFEIKNWAPKARIQEISR